MKNVTRQIVRHLTHKHSRLLQRLIIEEKLKSEEGALAVTAASATTSIVFTNFSHSADTGTTINCFSTNQVLVIIALTCFLNFAFIISVMMCVQILGSTATEREMLPSSRRYVTRFVVTFHVCSRRILFIKFDNSLKNTPLIWNKLYSAEEDALLNEERDDLLAETDVAWESTKFRVASFPDNVITRKVTERLLRANKLKANSEYWDEGFRRISTSPISRTYNFAPNRFYNDDLKNDRDIEKYNRDSSGYIWDDCGMGYSAIGVDPRRGNHT